MATSLGIDPMQILASLVGSQTSNDISRAGTETGTSSQAVSGTSNQAVSGSSTQQGTTTGQTGTQGTTQQSTQGVANVADLTSLMNQQRGGLTPEALKAIFTQGSEGMPNVIGAYSNAVGATTANNSGVQTALEGMMNKILQTAALSQQEGVNSAAKTAAEIARLTAGSTTSGTTANTQSSSQTQSQAGTTQQNVAGTQNQQVTGNTGKTSTEGTNQNQATSVDDSRVLGLLGLLLGGGVVNNGLTQAGLGGISGAVGSGMNAAGGGIADLLKMLGIGTGSGVDGTVADAIGGNLGAALPSGDAGAIDALLAEWLGGANMGTATGADMSNFWDLGAVTGG